MLLFMMHRTGLEQRIIQAKCQGSDRPLLGRIMKKITCCLTECLCPLGEGVCVSRRSLVLSGWLRAGRL